MIRLPITVDAFTLQRSTTGRTPVILLNGWQALCALAGSTSQTDSQKTFGNLWSYLQVDLVPVAYFNNCTYPNQTIEQLAATFGGYLRQLSYTDGSPVAQVDVIAHSMGGLIVRTYLAGLQSGGGLQPPGSIAIRKAVLIGTPNFGALNASAASRLFFADTQAPEMIPGSPFLWTLGRWNQNQDDLRGVDALAIVGNGGTSSTDDGVVSLTSASLGFAQIDQRTRVLPYCHTKPPVTDVDCPPTQSGIVDIDSPAHPTYQIVSSFLANTSAWTTIGTTATGNAWLSQFGGLFFAETNSSGVYIKLTQAALGTLNLQPNSPGDGVFYTDFIKGTGTFTSSTAGAFPCGPFTVPIGQYTTVRCKPGPQLSAVTPLIPAGTAKTVASGGSITLIGSGFGQTKCSTCQVVLFAGPQLLPISAWADSSITVTLPAMTGFAQIGVVTATGSDVINIMTAPLVTSSPVTIQTSPSGLQFAIDGGTVQTAPQTLTLSNGVHTFSVPDTQAGGTGTQYNFTSWSDGGTATHSFTVSAAMALTATFKTQYQLTMIASPPGGGTLLPASGSFYTAGTIVQLTAAPAAGYSFATWNGPVANPAASATSVTMNRPQTITASFSSIGPVINPGGVVPLYSSMSVIQSGSWISIYGSKFASTVTTWNGDFPTSLGGVSVAINNKPAFLWLVSPGQINLQAPDDATTGPVNITIKTPAGSTTSIVTLAPVGPAFCLLSGKYPAGVILRSDGTGAQGGGTYDLLGPPGQFAFPTRPVKAGDNLVLYGVGFGPTIPAVPAGKVFSGAARTIEQVKITIGGVPADVQFSGITAAGLYQFNVVVPAAPSGDQTLLATVAGVSTQGGIFIPIL